MRKLVWDASFRNAIKHQVHKKPELAASIVDCIEKLTVNPFDLSLKTNKLSDTLRN